MQGYIKLHRQFINWEWYDDANTMRLFIHCLLLANHKDKNWRGKTVKRGSFITSQPKLAHSLKLTIMQIRSCINKLKSTGEITVQTTPEYSVITVNNYNQYQEDNRQTNSRVTDEQQTNNRQITTTNNDKNDKNDKNIFLISEKKKKIDPYTNPLNDYFCKTFQEIFNTNQTVFLSNQSKNKLAELAAEYPNIRELLTESLKKLKEINFKDINFQPRASWLLKEDNFERVMNGEFDKNSDYDDRSHIFEELKEEARKAGKI